MSKRDIALKKRRIADDLVASSDEDDVKKSKSGSGEAQKNEEGETFFELSDKKRVTVRKFKGHLLVDVREFYAKGDTMLPGKKGISLNLEEFRELQRVIDQVGNAVDSK